MDRFRKMCHPPDMSGGAFRGRYGGRSLADEVFAERREQAAGAAGIVAER